MIAWVVAHAWAAGIVMLLLMWGDWALTILQERERVQYSGKHYESYPTNTIEGNPMLQGAVARRKLIEPRHLLLIVVFSAIVAYAIVWIPPILQTAFVGYAWGLYLVALTMHLGSFVGYRGSRRGIHGRIAMHLRTGYVVQAGRYLSLTILLAIVALFAASEFAAGVAVAALTSTARQYLWMRRVPAIDPGDRPPAGFA